MMAGTSGALVQDGSGVYILSNNHVLANENLLKLGSLSLNLALKMAASQTQIRLLV